MNDEESLNTYCEVCLPLILRNEMKSIVERYGKCTVEPQRRYELYDDIFHFISNDKQVDVFYIVNEEDTEELIIRDANWCTDLTTSLKYSIFTRLQDIITTYIKLEMLKHEQQESQQKERVQQRQDALEKLKHYLQDKS